MPLDLPDAHAPTEVELDREQSLTLRWADGTTSRFALADLRRNCPCAECRGRREQGEIPGGDATPIAVDAHLVGGWGLSIRWRDGHDTGIYSFDLLRKLCECPDCAS